jgi:hypothetical protein
VTAHTYIDILRERSARSADERAANLAASGIIIAADAYDAVVRGTTYVTDAMTVVRTWVDAHTGICRECVPPCIKPCAHGPVDAPRRVLVVSAGTGAGKSTAGAYAIARLGGRHAPASRVSEQARRLTSTDADRYDLALGASLLVVDDVGTAVNPKHERAAVHDIVDQRVGARPLTIITTNLDEDDFHKHLDPRTVSRLIGYAQFIRCTGDDLRVRPPVTATGAAT